jgi:hypothetical protein
LQFKEGDSVEILQTDHPSMCWIGRVGGVVGLVYAKHMRDADLEGRQPTRRITAGRQHVWRNVRRGKGESHSHMDDTRKKHY